MNKLLLTTVCALALAACHDNGSDDANGSASASPSLGLVQNATVNFFRADGITPLGTGNTGDAGTVDIDTGDYDGPIVVEVVGDDTDAMYFDEATGSFMPFPAGAVMRAIAPGPDAVAITPLTELAYRAAVRNNRFPLTAAAVNQLNAVVSNNLAGGIDILTPPALLSSAMSRDLPATDAGRYALVLATLAYMGNDGSNDLSDGTPPALSVLAALADDLQDGVLDGQNGQTPVAAAYNNFASEFAAALASAAAGYAGSDLNTEVANGDQSYESPAVDLSALNAADGGDTGGGNTGGDNTGGDNTGGGDTGGDNTGGGNTGGGDPNGSIVVPADSVWRVHVTGTVTTSGRVQNIDETREIPVNQVPTNNADGQVYADDLTQMFQDSLAESCNGPGGFQGTVEVTRFEYTSQGRGEVGTQIDVDYEFEVEGTCSISQNGQNFTTPFSLAGDILAEVERIQ